MESTDVRDMIGLKLKSGRLFTELPGGELIKPLKKMVLDLASKKGARSCGQERRVTKAAEACADTGNVEKGIEVALERCALADGRNAAATFPPSLARSALGRLPPSEQAAFQVSTGFQNGVLADTLSKWMCSGSRLQGRAVAKLARAKGQQRPAA